MWLMLMLVKHYDPQITVNFEDKEGGVVNEDLTFKNLGDFGKKGIIGGSDFLQGLEIESDQHLKIIKQLKTNKVLKQALQNPEAKESLISTIDALIAELSAAK